MSDVISLHCPGYVLFFYTWNFKSLETVFAVLQSLFMDCDQMKKCFKHYLEDTLVQPVNVNSC